MDETDETDKAVAALERIAAALERLADVYLYCNAPEEGDPEDAMPGQSLSDVPRGSGMGMG